MMDALRVEPVLASAIVAAANSPTHFRGERITDLEQAVYRLGYRETYRITLLITFRQGLRLANLPDSTAADYLWRRAVTTACAMEESPSASVDRTSAYTIGLLHLIGCLLLARHGEGDEVFDCTHPAALARAQAAAGTLSHPEAAALALELWNFPPQITAAVRWQYAPQQAGAYAAAAYQLSRACALANSIEECRPDSPLYRADAGLPDVSELERTVERRSYELIGLFYLAPPARPRWAQRTDFLPLA